MNAEQITFLNLRHFQGVLNREEAAWRLGFSPFEIDILVSGGRLSPLGKPKRNSKKVFATVEIERCIQDLDWLHRAQRTISDFWEKKNRGRRDRSASTQITKSSASRTIRLSPSSHLDAHIA